MHNVRNPAYWILSLWDSMERNNKWIGQSALVGWSRTFRLEPGDQKVLDCLSSLRYASIEAADTVKRLSIPDRKKDQLLLWTPAISESFADVVTLQSWGTALGRFTAERRAYLDLCVTEIDVALASVKTIDDINKLEQDISRLLEKLKKDDSIEDGFKALIHDLLESLRRALAEYSIRGSKGVMDSIAHILAALFKHGETFKKEENREWSSEVRNILALAADVATITGVTAAMLGGTIIKLLPP